MACDRIDIGEVEALGLSRVFDCFLVKEKHRQLHERIEVDVHRELEALNGVLLHSLALANSMIVNQDMNWAVFLNDEPPNFFCRLNVCQVGLIETDVFEVNVARDGLGVFQ